MTETGDQAHTIFVGGKPFMNYVTAVVMQFTTRGAEEVVVKSRGKFIYRAVDIAEVVKSRFLKDQVEVKNISIDSEEFTNKEGKLVRVSTMDITLGKSSSETAKSQVAEPVAEPVPEVIETPAEPVEETPSDSFEAVEPQVEEKPAEKAPVEEVVSEVPVAETE